MNRLYNAILFYSRLPVPKGVKCDPETLSQSLRYFPLIGIMVGVIGYGGYWLTNMILPHNISVIAAMVAMVLTTGALHEDGFADFCDGFGGGYTKESILRIMKDSHIGTYGVIGLIMMLLTRYTMLTSFDSESMAVVLILAQSASRFAPVAMTRLSTYARNEPSKSSHSALGIDMSGVVVAMLFALLPLVIVGWKITTCYILIMSILFILFRRYIHRHIEGFTGDTLGALQQIGEVIFYAILLAL
ncbi:MAG: adenosylcobinamide-GDP ribazoletransferase [Rikenellaceae bacterium]